jgi:glycosyltransferase involved in cell wall biosynthesis
MAANGKIRWYKKQRPSQSEAMNAGAWLARGEILLFLDDDIIPSPQLLKAHRSAHILDNDLAATAGQVLQPWDKTPVDQVQDFDLNFNFAYSRACETGTLMSGNFSIQRETFFAIGGMDENFIGSNYRNDSEMGYRIVRKTGRKIRFVPEATLRHLLAEGGNRAFGEKDSWGNIGGCIGDYYFALRALPWSRSCAHCFRRLFRAPVNRSTLHRPWLIPSLFLREIVAATVAVIRIFRHSENYMQSLDHYKDLRPALAT